MAFNKIKIRKGDKVVLLKGKDGGKSGKVIRVMSDKTLVVVENLNVFKKTVRPKRQGEKGQIVDRPFPIKVENVRLVCPSCSKATGIGYRVSKEIKERYCKKCEARI
jgi:large subunit ribosomal protein L24